MFLGVFFDQKHSQIISPAHSPHSLLVIRCEGWLMTGKEHLRGSLSRGTTYIINCMSHFIRRIKFRLRLLFRD